MKVAYETDSLGEFTTKLQGKEIYDYTEGYSRERAGGRKGMLSGLLGDCSVTLGGEQTHEALTALCVRSCALNIVDIVVSLSSIGSVTNKREFSRRDGVVSV